MTTTKSVDLSYTTAEFEMMKSATATLTLSEGATVSPDPSQTADYTQPLSFTVTAKDGKTARTYTTKPVEKVLEGYTKVEAAILQDRDGNGYRNRRRTTSSSA